MMIFSFINFLHDSVPYILSLNSKFFPKHLPARIHLLLESLVFNLLFRFLDHSETPLIYLPLHIFLRLNVSILKRIATRHDVINSKVFFVGSMIKQLVEVGTHTEWLSVFRRSSHHWLRHVVLKREIGERDLFMLEQLIYSGFWLV